MFRRRRLVWADREFAGRRGLELEQLLSSAADFPVGRREEGTVAGRYNRRKQRSAGVFFFFSQSEHQPSPDKIVHACAFGYANDWPLRVMLAFSLKSSGTLDKQCGACWRNFVISHTAVSRGVAAARTTTCRSRVLVEVQYRRH